MTKTRAKGRTLFAVLAILGVGCRGRGHGAAPVTGAAPASSSDAALGPMPVVVSSVPHPETLPPKVTGTTFLADGTLLVRLEEGFVLVPADGARRVRVPSGRVAGTGPSGTIASFEGRREASELVVRSPDGSVLRRIALGFHPSHQTEGMTGFFGQRYVVEESNRTLHIYSLEDGSEWSRVETHSAGDDNGVLDPTASWLAESGPDLVNVRPTKGDGAFAWRVEQSTTDGYNALHPVAFGQDGQLVAHYSAGDYLFDLHQRHVHLRGSLLDPVWTPDGSRVVLNDGKLLLFDPRNPKRTERIAFPKAPCVVPAAKRAADSCEPRWTHLFWPTGEDLVVLGEQGDVNAPDRLLVWRRGQPLRTLATAGAELEVAPDGRTVLVFTHPPRLFSVPDDPLATWPSRPLSWDVESPLHASTYASARRPEAFSPDGKRVALASPKRWMMFDVATMGVLAEETY